MKKTAIVTGAGRGIGFGIAKRLAEEDYRLVLVSRSEENRYAEHLDLLRRSDTDFLYIQADVSEPSDRERCLDLALKKYGRIDVLVNNAGIAHIGLLTDLTSDEWHRIMAVNLDSCFYTCRAAIPLMLKNHCGKIINISSVWGTQGASMEVAYSASKGGLNAGVCGLTRALAKELAPSGIQVNAIACGVIDTSMNSCLTPEDKAALTAEIPADRLGLPEEAARLILQTAQAPAYMTGQIITIDGGWY